MRKIIVYALILLWVGFLVPIAKAEGNQKADGSEFKIAVTYIRIYDETNFRVGVAVSNVSNKTLEQIEDFKFDIYSGDSLFARDITLSIADSSNPIIMKPGSTIFRYVNAQSIIPDTANAGYYHASQPRYTAKVSENSEGNKLTDGIHIFINGNEIKTTSAPVIKDGSTLIPMRNIFESLGSEISWDDKTRTVTAKRADYEAVWDPKTKKTIPKSMEVVVKHVIDTDILYSNLYNNGNMKVIKLPIKSEIIDGNSYVPLRAVSQAFGSNVFYGQDGETTIITIYDRALLGIKIYED